MISHGAVERLFGHVIRAVLLAMALVLAGLVGAPCVARADDPGNPIGAVHVGVNTRYCFTYADLKSELEAQKNKTVSVEMYRDWGWDVMTSRLIIPENSRVTLNMDGHKMDRELAGFGSWADDGEMILVRAGAMLTINGQPGGSSYEAYVYESTDPHAAPVARGGFAGGLITGGASTKGAGGIHVNKGATVTLNDVTIAGCRAQKGSVAKAGSISCGYGGGMYLAGGDITVNLRNSTITGNYASGDGGGIYADSSGAATINLVNSHIDANCAGDDAGGIDADGKGTRIGGDGRLGDDGNVTGSTVSGNKCAARGGGILAWNSDTGVSRLVLEGNQAKLGGALCATQDRLLLNKLVIRGNQAEQGGGLYFPAGSSGEASYAGDTSIADCQVTGNSAERYGGAYFDDGTALNGKRKRVFNGVTTVKDNVCSDGSDFRNLCIASKEWWCKQESFNLSEGSEVWVAWEQAGTWLKLRGPR